MLLSPIKTPSIEWEKKWKQQQQNTSHLNDLWKHNIQFEKISR